MNRRRKRLATAHRSARQRILAGGGVLFALLLLCVAPLVGQAKQPPKSGVVVPIKGEINDVLTRSIERRLDEAKMQGVDLVVFEMNTPGGLVTSALDISKMIKSCPKRVFAPWPG